MHFRRATAADLSTYIEFQLALAWESEELRLDPGILTAGAQNLFADPSKGQPYILECDGQIAAGCLITYEWSDWRNGMVWWLQSVYVRPEFRRRGLFRKMFEELQQLIAADPHVRGMRLYVDKRNVSAQQTYAQLGMNGDHYQVFEKMKS
jgi:ribosomal protein S18 acetylase RimI-like enzyme